jgi:predicted 2-oxoglutarate/Fe(II)-dependent dioxygenase YbiX
VHEIPNPVLRSLGVRVFAEVWSATELEEIRRAMMSGHGKAGETLGEVGSAAPQPTHAIADSPSGDKAHAGLNEQARRTQLITVSDLLRRSTAATLTEILLTLNHEPPVALTEKLSFLRYGPNDGYTVHRDSSPPGSHEDRIGRRRVSLVAFVNAQATADVHGDYQGGTLQFYPPEDSPFAGHAFSAHQLSGTVVTFPALLPHEVTRVVSGTRLTIAAFAGVDQALSAESK